MNLNNLAYLENLAKCKSLDHVPPSPSLALNKLLSAKKRLADARSQHISRETRFDAAYNAIRDMAEIGLLIRGFRTVSKGGGHHQMAIQCLKHTLAIDDDRIQIIDRLRKQRHVADYEGETVTQQELSECIRQAEQLLPILEDAMKLNGWAVALP